MTLTLTITLTLTLTMTLTLTLTLTLTMTLTLTLTMTMTLTLTLTLTMTLTLTLTLKILREHLPSSLTPNCYLFFLFSGVPTIDTPKFLFYDCFSLKQSLVKRNHFNLALYLSHPRFL